MAMACTDKKVDSGHFVNGVPLLLVASAKTTITTLG